MFNIKEIEKTNASVKIVDQFRQGISSGVLKVGDKIPSERQLSESFGVSRSSIREGLTFLSAYGIIESKPGEGTFITDKFSEQVFDFLGIGDIKNKTNYINLIKFRKILEVGLVDEIIENITPEDYEKLSNLVNEIKAEKQPERIANLDLKLHENIIKLSRNEIIVQIYKMSFKLINALIMEFVNYPHVQDSSYCDHKEILDYLINGDSENAKKL